LLGLVILQHSYLARDLKQKLLNYFTGNKIIITTTVSVQQGNYLHNVLYQSSHYSATTMSTESNQCQMDKQWCPSQQRINVRPDQEQPISKPQTK
jgi:hypothetical protein